MSAEKRCTRPGCSMRDIDVTTDVENCLGCGAELKDVNEGRLRKLLGGRTLDEFFKGMRP